jgi:hypothetical protein
MIIASMSRITYGSFVVYIGPSMIISLAINLALLSRMYELRFRIPSICLHF